MAANVFVAPRCKTEEEQGGLRGRGARQTQGRPAAHPLQPLCRRVILRPVFWVGDRPGEVWRHSVFSLWNARASVYVRFRYVFQTPNQFTVPTA